MQNLRIEGQGKKFKFSWCGGQENLAFAYQNSSSRLMIFWLNGDSTRGFMLKLKMLYFLFCPGGQDRFNTEIFCEAKFMIYGSTRDLVVIKLVFGAFNSHKLSQDELISSFLFNWN